MGSFVQAIGLATSAYSAASSYADQSSTRSAADFNSSRARILSDSQIKDAKNNYSFQAEQYGDWKNIYGDLQKNLGDYYKNLTPEKVTALGLENQQKEFQQVQTSISQDYAQRGLSNSGQEMSSLAMSKMQNASDRASIRNKADQTVAEEKMKFLQLGLGQGTQMLGQINNAAGNVTNAYTTGVNSATQMSGNYLDASVKYGLNAADTMSDIGGSLFGS